MSELRRSSLSERKRALLALLQQINFGRIEGLVVRGGEPVLEPPPRVLSTFKFGGETEPSEAIAESDFVLKRPVVELFGHLDKLGDGVVASLDVKHGLPCHMAIEGPQAARTT